MAQLVFISNLFSKVSVVVKQVQILKFRPFFGGVVIVALDLINTFIRLASV